MSSGVDHEIGRVEEQLGALRRSIPVNNVLMRDLRARFQTEPRKQQKLGSFVAVAAFLVIAICASSYWGLSSNSVLAAGLEIIEQFSFIDIVSGQYGAPAVFGEQLFLPVYDKGIYRYDTTSVVAGEGLTRIVDDGNVNEVTVNHAGSKLAYMTSNGIYLVDLDTGEIRPIIEGNGFTVFYEEPIWAPDDRALVVTRKEIEWQVHGHTLKSSEIYQVNANTGEQQKLADGSCPSLTPDGSILVFERDGNILLKALRDQSIWPWKGLRKGEEQQLGAGRFPRVSPDGALLSFIKTTVRTREPKQQVFVHEELMDVYVASFKDFTDQKQITANFPLGSTDEARWVENASAGSILHVTGDYSYYSPIWGSDSQSLYVPKTYQNAPGMRLMRVSLAKSGLDKESTVTRWLSAAVNRDSDAARRLMANPSDCYTMSNPHPVGYAVLGSGIEGGLDYVDALQYVAYTGQPWYQVRQLRFLLVQTGKGYLIDQVQETVDWQVFLRDGALCLQHAGETQQLLSLQAAGLQQDQVGAVSLNPSTGEVFLSVREREGMSIRLVQSGKTSHLFSLSGQDVNVTCISSAGGFVVINFDRMAPQGNAQVQQSRAMLFSLEDRMPVQTLGRASMGHWANDELVLYTERDGQMVRWQYDPKTAQSSLWP